MKNSKYNRFLVSTRAVIAASGLGLTMTAGAATAIWTGAVDGLWDTTTENWTGTTFTSGDDAVFSGTPTNNVTTATDLTVGAITLNSDFTGSVALTGNNTVSGATTISGGILLLMTQPGEAVGAVTATNLGTSAVTINGGGQLYVDDEDNGTAGGERILSLGNTITGAGTLQVRPSTVHTAGWSSVNFTGDLSGFTGTLNVLAGSTINRAKTKFTAASQATVLSSSATVNVELGSQLYLTQAYNYGFGIQLNGGTGGENFGSLRLDNALLDVTGALTLHADSIISGAGKISGVIGDSGSIYRLTKVANNTTVLTGPNTYSGGTTISAGTVSVGNNTALGSGAVTMGGGNLSNTTGVTLTNNFTLNNGTTFTAGSGTLVLNGNITGSPNGNWNLTPTNKITLGGTNNITFSNDFGGLLMNTGAGGVDITGSTTINGNVANQQSGYISIIGTTTISVVTGGSLAVNGTSHATKPNSIIGQNAAGTSTLAVNGGSLTIGTETGFALGNNVATATGVLTVSSGTVTIAAGSATLQNALNFVALGRDAATGIVNLDGGTLATGRQFVRDGSSGGTAGSGTATFNFNGGTLQAQADQTSGNGWFETATSGNFQVVTTTVKVGGAKIDTNGFTTNINTVLTHDSALGGTADGGLTKSGLGTLTLTGTNTYTGDTTVSAGVLAVDGDAIPNSGKLVINGGKVDPTGATEVVDTLYFGAAQQAFGTWGATGSGATHINDTHFTGTGVVSVSTGPGGGGGYTSWANANGATGQTMDQDHDGDGVDNGIEYFMGQTGFTFTANPAPVSETVTWPMSATYAGVYGTDYEVQFSTDLAAWTKVEIGTGDNTVTVTAGTSVVYNMPTGGKSFVRLVVKN